MPVWVAWHESVPAIGLTCLLQTHPGSNSPRPKVTSPKVNTAILPFPSLNGRNSSGRSTDFFVNAFFSIVAVMASPFKKERGPNTSGGFAYSIFAIESCM